MRLFRFPDNFPDLGRFAARGLRPETMLFIPVVMLAGFWVGGEVALISLALGLPVVLLPLMRKGPDLPARVEGPLSCSTLVRIMDVLIGQLAKTKQTTGCFVIQFDASAQMMERHGRAIHSELLSICTDRIRRVTRSSDLLCVLEDGSLALVLAPVRRLRLETMIQLAVRLQGVVEEPILFGAEELSVSCSIGFCREQTAPKPTGKALLDAAQIAADEAMRHGPGAIRSFSEDMARRQVKFEDLRAGLETAFAEKAIKAHFQPQICTRTGEVSGVEALARWHHPVRGCLLPAEFLPAVESSGLSGRLNQTMLEQALCALAEWDQAGFRVPSVSVNFSATELRDPRVPERLKWELDRFDLTPDRLTIEILETVAADTRSDMIAANIAAIAALGCGIDLDDFGTGSSSITTLRRFAVRRVKIDRSFVSGVDHDPDQQRTVAAILSLSGQMGLATVAEGVETAEEHQTVMRLGCGHVQGYAFARPMPLGEATDWLIDYAGRQASAALAG
jgi:diguanylate cyclase